MSALRLHNKRPIAKMQELRANLAAARAGLPAPVASCLEALQQSFTRFPNITPGQEFNGYQ